MNVGQQQLLIIHTTYVLSSACGVQCGDVFSDKVFFPPHLFASLTRLFLNLCYVMFISVLTIGCITKHNVIISRSSKTFLIKHIRE